MGLNKFGAGIPIELQWAGADSKTVTPSAAVQQHQCELRGLPIRDRKHNLAVLRAVVEAEIVVNQPASGASVINDDKLPKAIVSLALWAPGQGYIYQHEHTPGAAHHAINQVVANGYRIRGVRDTAIPTTDATYTRVVRYELPLALPLMADEMDTAQFTGLLEGGRIEVKVAASTVFGSDSTAATLDSVVLRAWIEVVPTRKLWVPGLFGFRQYSQGGGVTNFRLEGLGSAQGLQWAEQGCALGGVWMLTDATGIGLGGSDGADNVIGVQSEDLDLPNIVHVPTLFDLLERQMDGHPGGDGGMATLSQNRWPYACNETVWSGGRVDMAYLLPLRLPARGQLLSRLRRFNGDQRDVRLKYTFTSTPSGEMKHGTLEFYKPSPDLETRMREIYGIPSTWRTSPKPISGKPVSGGAVHALRYGARRVFFAP